MVVPSTQHLYVLQNEFGLIKIGRSLDLQERVRALRFQDRCHPSVVGVFENQGDGEEWLLHTLSDHNVFGEWFDGTDAARLAVEDAVGHKLEWPHPHRPRLAQRWAKTMLALRRIKKAHREMSRMRERGVDLETPNVALDTLFLDACRPSWLPKDGFPSLHRGVNDWMVSWSTISKCGQFERKLILPYRYTADVKSALTLWPDEARPVEWDGTPFSCCLSALRAREQLLRVG